MQLERFKAALLKTNIDFLENENMSLHTTFKIGGEADVFINVKSSEELESSLKLAKENGVPYLILGKGSNLLISDLGIEGAVISTKLLDNIKIDGTRIICEPRTFRLDEKDPTDLRHVSRRFDGRWANQ